MAPTRRLRFALSALVVVLVVGTIGYMALGFGAVDAMYQTVTTITTVGFREVHPLTTTGKWFTMVLILVGVGTALYAFGVLLETFVEGPFRQARKRKRVENKIGRLRDHVVVCGWGRVGRAIAAFVAGQGADVVVIDTNAERIESSGHLGIVGDATADATLRAAGIDHARALVAAIDTDADNLYVTLSGRSLQPDLFIVARARDEASEAKLLRAGADRVVNPQALGGARMGAMVMQPYVAEFLDVVMHDGSLEFRLEEIAVPERSPIAGVTLRDAEIRDRTGALILAMRDEAGEFHTNPGPGTMIRAGSVLIAVGTADQLSALEVVSGVSRA